MATNRENLLAWFARCDLSEYSTGALDAAYVALTEHEEPKPMTYARMKQRLQRAVDSANAAHGAHEQDTGLVDAVERFPCHAGDVSAYRATLAGLAPEIRSVLEDALEQVDRGD